MNHAILLLWHKDLIQLKELISLFGNNFVFYIHIDKKTRLSKEEIKELSELKQVTGVYSKYKINWGGFNILKAELFLLKEIVKDKRTDYVHFLSGQDYPAMKPEDIDSFFEKCGNNEFLSYFKLPFYKWEEGTYKRFDYFRLHDWFDYRTPHGQKIINLINRIQIKLGYKRRIPYQYSNLYGGSNWMSITRACAEFLTDSLPANKSFYNRLKYTWAPEETYFPTVIMNSDYSQKVIKDSLRYINWVYNNGSFPAILDEKDFENILLSGCCFIRKTDRNISKTLTAHIKKYILYAVRDRLSEAETYSAMAGRKDDDDIVLDNDINFNNLFPDE